MASTSEKGHAKNVANFEDLISYCAGYGATYNPNLNAIKIANLTILRSNAGTSLVNVDLANTSFRNATNNREIAFYPIKKLSTKIIHALKASGVSAQTLKDAMSIQRKLQGSRAKARAGKKSERAAASSASATTPVPNTPAADTGISTSQQSYDSIIDYFGKMILLLNSVSAYAPNETELKVTSLTTVLNNLKTVNTSVISATTVLSNSRILRNDLLYKAGTGLVDIANEVKSYVRSVYGSSSGQYKQVVKLKFRRYAV